jgi:hypothetical protein
VYHPPVTFQVVADVSQSAQFFHGFLEFGDFCEHPAALHRVFAHVSVLSGCGEAFWRVLSSFVGFPKGQSVIEEKGEGFENGKKLVGSFGVPSTSVSLQTASQDLRYYILINLTHQK